LNRYAPSWIAPRSVPASPSADHPTMPVFSIWK
jgi:hypothetical protein